MIDDKLNNNNNKKWFVKFMNLLVYISGRGKKIFDILRIIVFWKYYLYV